jgi:hypothetical protein
MKTLKVNGNLGEFELNLPESLREISNDYFKECTEFVNPAPNYVLVAVVYKDSLSLVLSSAKKNKPANVAIIPVFIKAGKTESDFINSLSCGDRVVISGSALSLAHHINSPYNKITPTNIINICEGDKNIYSEALTMQTPVCFVEFKLVAANELHAMLEDSKTLSINPFVKKVMTNVGEA